MWWLVYLFLEVVWYLYIIIWTVAEKHLVPKSWKWSIGLQWLFLMFYWHFPFCHTDLAFVDRWKHFFINVLIFPLISLYTFPSPGLVSQSNILIPPPLRSQGDLVTQPSQSKLDATIGCRFVAAFFNCPSIPRPATEFYRDLKEKDAVISSVPKMRKNEDVSITREHRHNVHRLTRSAHKTIHVRAMASKIETPMRDKILGHFSIEYGQSGWWNLRVEDILIRACLATLAR